MSLIILVIFVAIIVYILYKLSFASRLKIGIFLIILLGLHHVYVAISSVDKEDVNEAIEDYVKKCGASSTIKFTKNEAITLFSEAASNASKESLNKAKSRLYSEHLLQIGEGGVSDVLNFLPAYIAENYLGFNFKKEIEQIGMKAGIDALEKTECNRGSKNDNETSYSNSSFQEKEEKEMKEKNTNEYYGDDNERLLALIRFGTLEINDDNMLLFNSNPLFPEVQGNSSLTILKVFALSNSDIILVQDNGGSACPALLYIVEISNSGAISTDAFGSCSDIINYIEVNKEISITMPGFQGPFEPEENREKAAKQKYKYIYKDGKLTKSIEYK